MKKLFLLLLISLLSGSYQKIYSCEELEVCEACYTERNGLPYLRLKIQDCATIGLTYGTIAIYDPASQAILSTSYSNPGVAIWIPTNIACTGSGNPTFYVFYPISNTPFLTNLLATQSGNTFNYTFYFAYGTGVMTPANFQTVGSSQIIHVRGLCTNIEESNCIGDFSYKVYSYNYDVNGVNANTLQNPYEFDDILLNPANYDLSGKSCNNAPVGACKFCTGKVSLPIAALEVQDIYDFGDGTTLVLNSSTSPWLYNMSTLSHYPVNHTYDLNATSPSYKVCHTKRIIRQCQYYCKDVYNQNLVCSWDQELLEECKTCWDITCMPGFSNVEPIDHGEGKALKTAESIKTNSEITLFPNPSDNVVFVKIPANYNKEIGEIQILDLTGKVIRNPMISKDEKGMLKVDIKNLANGTYIMKIAGKESSEKLKFTVLH